MCNQILSTIHYNYKGREYEVSAETGALIAAYPSGDAGKQAAAEAALLHDDPHAHAAAFYLVHDLFRRRHDLHGRIWKAARLVADGQLFAPHPLATRMHLAAHAAASDGRFYPIREYTDDSGWSCDCHDCMFHHAPHLKNQMLCKHIIAAKIHRIIKRPLPPYLASPKNLIAWLEETGAELNVIGAYNQNTYTAYPEPIRRTAVVGEVIIVENRFYRLIGSKPHIQTCDVTDELASATNPRHVLRLQPSTAAHHAAVCAAHPPQLADDDNHKLTAALKSMTAAAKRNYPSKATMTDLDAADWIVDYGNGRSGNGRFPREF